MPHKSGLSDLLVNIGINTKRFRKLKKMTQQELAYQCDMDKSSVSNIERLDYCNVTICSLVRLSIALECKVEDLMQKNNPN